MRLYRGRTESTFVLKVDCREITAPHFLVVLPMFCKNRRPVSFCLFESYTYEKHWRPFSAVNFCFSLTTYKTEKQKGFETFLLSLL